MKIAASTECSIHCLRGNGSTDIIYEFDAWSHNILANTCILRAKSIDYLIFGFVFVENYLSITVSRQA
jgi:hypothetical protein